MVLSSSLRSPQKYARIAGILYLIIIISAGFSQGFIRSSLIVPGDATATANNIMASEFLFRLGFSLDLIAFISDLFVAVILYVLLKPVNNTIALMAGLLRLLAHPAIASINLLNHFSAFVLLKGDNYLNVFSPEQLHAFVMFFQDLHSYGYLIGGAFFGFHCIILGYLLVKSGYFPQIFGVLMILAGFGYLIESFGNFLIADAKDILVWFVAIPAVIAEFSFTLYLLIKGVNMNKWRVQGSI